MRIRLGLLDSDIQYMDAVANYFSAHYNIQMELNLFTSEEGLHAFLDGRGRLDVLLADPDLLTEPDRLYGRTVLAYLCEEPHVTQWGGQHAMCKYQKAEALYRAIQGLAAEVDRGGYSYDSDARGEVYVFAGAAGGVGCSVAAMCCAARLAAQGRKVLYISLQQCAAADRVFQQRGASMTQVLYELKTARQVALKPEQLRMKLQSLLNTDTATGVMCYDGFELPLEAMDLTAEDVDLLIGAAKGMADVCILDVDGRMGELFLTTVRQSEWTVLVSDGTNKANICLQKLLQSMELLDGGEEPLLRGHLGVLYTRFGSAARQLQLPGHVRLLGKIPNYTGAAESAIMQELMGSSVFAMLES